MRAKGSSTSPSPVPPPGREGTDTAAMDELADLIAAAGGRTLALFSSWRGVERAAEHLAESLPDKLLDRGIVPLDVPVLVQKRGDSVADLVSRFAAEPRSVLLGTLSLWQGVDVPGEACHLVVIDRIPFPRPDDPLVAARSKFAEDHGGNGFTAVSVPRAALLLAQGVGRLIRSSTDRGVVAVLDPRLRDRALRRLPAPLAAPLLVHHRRQPGPAEPDATRRAHGRGDEAGEEEAQPEGELTPSRTRLLPSKVLLPRWSGAMEATC